MHFRGSLLQWLMDICNTGKHSRNSSNSMTFKMRIWLIWIRYTYNHMEIPSCGFSLNYASQRINKGRDYGCFHTIYWLLCWRELSLWLIILHARLKGGLVITIIPIVTWVPRPDLLASIEKGTPHRATAQRHSIASRRSGRACTSSHRWLHEDLLTHGGSREVAG